MKSSRLAFVGLLMGAAGAALAAQPGVDKVEIRLGVVTDLSGPLLPIGKPATNGINMRIKEVNDAGGVHGRKIKYLIEDSGYDTKKALLLVQKLVERDDVFGMLGLLGSSINLSSMSLLFDNDRLNFLPVGSFAEAYEPVHKYKFSFFPSYVSQMTAVVPKLVQEKGSKTVCILHQDDDYGHQVLTGTEHGLKAIGRSLAAKTTYKRGATDFSSQVARLKAASCDMVVLGTVTREVVATLTEAKKNDFRPVWLGAFPVYHESVPALGGDAVEGLYAPMSVSIPYPDELQGAEKDWAMRYKAQYGDEANVWALMGYTMANAFVEIAKKAGPNLTTKSFIDAAERMDRIAGPIPGTPDLRFTADERLGQKKSRLSQVQKGRWKIVSDYF